MKEKALKLIGKLGEIEAKLGEPGVTSDQKQFKLLTQEHSRLSKIKDFFDSLEKSCLELKDNESLLKEAEEEEFKEMLEEEIARLKKEIPFLENQLESLLVPPDPNDHRNVIMELRAGTGGDEAALFVADCIRMYQFFADSQGWNYESLSCTPSDLGGYKEYIMVLSGNNVHRFLQFESGGHRVQRVPETETQGRVHTSAITVAILLEPEEDEEIVIDEKDLRIDTMRASGAGGQHVNTTDSAVRITHLPTGIVVGCKEEKSQHKNKDKSMRLLQAKLVEMERLKKEKEIASTRAAQVGSGDRSERIRTYNFSQNRLTDHRINLTLYRLEVVMGSGELLDVVQPLVAHFHQKKLEALS
jgi:peptide chain release factor 1